VASGADVARPWGQLLPPGASAPVVAPTACLDFEVEVAALIGRGNPLGSRIAVDDAAGAIFGYVLMNDWSARDIQARARQRGAERKRLPALGALRSAAPLRRALPPRLPRGLHAAAR